MTGIHSKVAGLSTAKRLLLEKELRLLRERGKAAATTTIPRRTLFTPSPPSFSQVRLWFLDQLKPGGSVYNMPIAVRLEGVLDVGALASALNALVDRHEILRTRFGVEDGGPVQVIAPALKVLLPMEDLSSIPAQDQAVELQREMQSAADIPFDLAQGPLFRASLIRLGERTHVLVLTLHHIISDGWSRGVLMRELSALYASHCQAKPSPLPALPIQYADYAIWQRDRLQGEVLEKQVSYWREQLKDLEVLNLPTDRPRPAVQSSRGAQLHFELPAALSKGLEALSQRAGVTLFMTLLAGFQVLLQRYSGQDDIVVGSPTAGRNRIEIEGLIGFFVNTLVLRTDLSGDPTFMALLGRVREVALGAYAHQELPFEKLVEELQPERDQSRNPLFQVGFVLQNTPHAELVLPGIKASLQTVQTVVAKFDLSLSILNKNRRLQGVVEYNADLFDAVTIGRLAEHYRILLEGVLAEPDQPVTGLPLLTGAERCQLLEDWNATEAAYSKDQCAQQLFEAQVARNPEAVAVVHQDQQLSYAELNARANQLAHYLRAQGVGPNVLVAICVERSLDMIIGVLGILKAGGAYVPLDPGCPRDRLAFMLEDTHAPVLVTQAALSGALPRGDFEVLCLDSDWNRIERESDKNTENLAGPEHLAYVIYTSGSTGVPKGVEIQHRSLVNLVTWYHKHIITSPQDRATLIAGPAFDASVANIWPTITAGASLYIPDEETRLSPDLLLDWYASNKITVSYLPTPLATLLIDLNQPVGLVLRILLAGGDKLTKGPTEALPYRFINLYGPTESTVETTWADIAAGHVAPPIGRPISNTQVYILDAQLRPVPIGVVGELYIGGDGLARGYLNRPELTAERFISNPLPGTLGERLYRTGDLVRYRADGNIEFVSRNDDQVKIRGFRIELGEIETTLSRHPQVRDSIVMVREEEAGEKRLVAYVVTGQVAEDFRTTLRDCLKKTLPEYMVPTAFITLDAFPLTPNGKVDKQALSALDPAQSLDTEYVAPGTPFEEELAAIWCELLRLDRVGIHDNFFQLGGHSLLVMQVISRIKSVFQIDLALQTFFEYPTVAGISRIVINTKMEKADDRDLESILSELEEITEIVRRENFSPSPVSFTQWRLWFLDQLAPGSPVYNIPSAVRLEGVLDVEALEAALNALVDRHEVLRTRFGVEEGNPVQLIATELKVPLPVDDLGGIPQQEQEAELQKRIQSEYNVPFDLAQCPLLRARLLRLGERTHVLVLTLHHIISDGWSMYVLMGELSVLYGACCQSEPSPLPALRVQYADYAIWHREWLQGEVLAEQLSYWQEQLKDLSVLNFPTDRPYPARQSYRGEEQYCDLPAILTERLEELGQRAGATLFMTLLAAFQMLLQRYSGQDDIVVGSPIAGRNKVDTESLIGFFVNTLVLRTDLSGDPTFMELLKRVREVALGAYAHQDLPFDKLVEELRPERALSRNPLFDVLINFHVERDDNSGVFGSPDLKISPEKFSQKLSKFAFTLYIRLVNGQLKLELAYRTDMLDSDRMRCLLQQFQHLLEQIVAMPEQTIQSYSLVTPESHKLLPDPTVILDEPQQQTIPEIFAGIAARLPDNVAVSQNNKNWTYDDLNKASLRLAATLHVQGAEPGDVIAVFGRRSFGLIASLLAVLRAGGVILPVDNSLPPGRQEIMFRESRARMILNIDGDTALHAGLETLHVNAETGCLDGVISDCESGVTGFTEPGANDPAYIFFTSGSTGIPKAVLGCHKSLSHFLCWQRDKFAVGPGDRVAQLTALSFDVVLRDIFLPLTSGGTVCLPEDKDLVNILQWVEREAITVIHSVPAVIRLWLESRHEGASLHSLRWLFVAGEPLTDVLVQQWRAAFPVSGMMVNLYGATETALVKCFHLLDGEIKNGIQLIGDALPQTQALVLRRNRQLCGIGETGEIVIRTPFMTLGYLNNEAENRKRFIKNPFRDDEQDMLYFTGDRGCYRPDGKLEIRGRLDEQVKIRGIRIEPAEVAATLSLHDSIHDCTVITQKDQSDNCALVAYVVPEKNSGITAGELRTDLGYYLQGAFIPSAFIFMEQLPLLPNGKVDRKALPAANLNNPDPGQKPVTPRTPVEKILAELWMTVLGIKQVGIHDNFFHLGGHSLLVIKAILRINSVLRTEFPLVTFFQLPTIAEQASRIEQDRLGNIHERVEGILDELESLPEEDQ